MQSKKSYIVLHISSSLKVGGAESLLVDMVRVLKEKGVVQTVLYFHDGPNREKIEQMGVNVHQISGLICRYDALFWYRLYRRLKHINPSVIHSWLWAANLLARVCGKFLSIPVINSIHLGMDQDGRVRNSIDRYTIRYADALVPISDQVANSMDKAWIPAHKILVIKNGIDIGLIQSRSIYGFTRKNIGIADNAFVIGSVGRFIPRKNYSLLLEVFAQLCHIYDDLVLLLIGYGEQELQLRGLAKKLGIHQRVVFIIEKPAYGYYPLMNCFVLSSMQEGLSIALLEAMSFGVPSVVTHEGEVHDLVIHEYNGLLVPTNNSDALYSNIERMIIETNFRNWVSANAFSIVVTEFNLEKMITEYQQLYEKVIQNNVKKG